MKLKGRLKAVIFLNTEKENPHVINSQNKGHITPPTSLSSSSATASPPSPPGWHRASGRGETSAGLGQRPREEPECRSSVSRARGRLLHALSRFKWPSVGNPGILTGNGGVGAEQGPVVLVLLHQIETIKYIYYYVLLQRERTHQLFPHFQLCT